MRRIRCGGVRATLGCNAGRGEALPVLWLALPPGRARRPPGYPQAAAGRLAVRGPSLVTSLPPELASPTLALVDVDELQAPGLEVGNAGELAQMLGVARSTAYGHAEELSALKVGNGARPRLRFDPHELRDVAALVDRLADGGADRMAAGAGDRLAPADRTAARSPVGWS
jgi:hypothetical protein